MELCQIYRRIILNWLKTGIKTFRREYTIATDLKLCNILLGLMTHSSTHPCFWCDVKKGNLDEKGVSRTIANMMELFWNCSGIVLELFWNYFEARAEKKHAKDYGNVVHPDMSNSAGTIDESTLIILLVHPPELRLLLGLVNTLYDALSNLWPPYEQWSQKLHIKRGTYHVGVFNGNDCRKLIKNVSVLEDIAPEFHGFVDTFKSFDNVVKSCYGKEPASNYKRTIYEFKKSYMKLGISATPKV